MKKVFVRSMVFDFVNTLPCTQKELMERLVDVGINELLYAGSWSARPSWQSLPSNFDYFLN